jgi:hypothetical protein
VPENDHFILNVTLQLSFSRPISRSDSLYLLMPAAAAAEIFLSFYVDALNSLHALV